MRMTNVSNIDSDRHRYLFFTGFSRNDYGPGRGGGVGDQSDERRSGVKAMILARRAVPLTLLMFLLTAGCAPHPQPTAGSPDASATPLSVRYFQVTPQSY